MSFHDDLAAWQRLALEENCPVCNRAPMPDTMVDIAELPASWLSVEPADCLKGACHLIAKQHAVELFDLPDANLLALMKDVAACARAILAVTGAVKINYEIHGNTVPHLHVHLYPRYVDDPFPSQPIDYRKLRSDWYREGEFAAFVAAVRLALAQYAGA